MNSLQANLNINLTGKATGTADNSSLGSPVRGRVAVSLASTGTGSTLANQAFGGTGTTLTLAASGTVTYDLTTGLENILGESISGAAAFAKVRMYMITHLSTSAASSITVGNATNPFGFFGLAGTNTLQLKPGEGFAFWSATTAGMGTIDGTHKAIKIANNDGTNSARYQISIIGSIT